MTWPEFWPHVQQLNVKAAFNDVQALNANLDKAGVEHEIVVYPDAPHSFFDRRSADFAEASSNAWRRFLGFIKAHTPA
jgi:carboxymethylenebutenolidase